MTASDARSFAKSLGGLILACCAPLLVALLVGAWKTKENAEDHHADIAAIQSDVQRILDVVCEDRKVTRACK